MKRNSATNKVLSQILAAVYLFVILFSQNFHEHSSSAEFKKFHFTRADRAACQSKIVKASADCLACHIFSEGHAVLPEIASAELLQLSGFAPSVPAHSNGHSFSRNTVVALRGPPTAPSL